MKKISLIILMGGILALQSAKAVDLIVQNFNGDPVNYTLQGISNPFKLGTSSTDYWGLSNMAGITLNGSISGNVTTYLTAQDMDDTGMGFTDAAPGTVDFSVPAFGYTNFALSIDIAGLGSAEANNFIRAFTDNDNNGTYETQVFNFVGNNNSPYIDANTSQQLTSAFATYTRSLSTPSGADLRFRIEIFNDTASSNEAVGVDNIKITAVPEPSTGLLALAGVGMLLRRRRR